MARTVSKAALVAGALALGASAAFAQFGSIFGDPPPRPPGGVPGGRQANPPLPPQDYVYPPPSQSYPSSGYPPSRQAPPGGPYGGVQSQPLPPPPGANVAPSPRATTTAPAPRTPRQPAAAAPPPADEVISAPSTQKIVHPTAKFTGLDKITGRIMPFEVSIGETVQFGALQLTTQACYTRPPTETAVTDAFVEVDEVTLQGEVRRIFTGWIFAESPGLSAIEHPIYDLWLNECKGGAQTVTAEAPAAETPPPRAQKKAPKAPPRRQPPPPQQGYPPFR
jgi:hypothetical protein